ncbi:alpha/beta hydrolase [Cryobacterium breve]|uniref:alpha/beta hydrolase n=1 Tax=Cryobacterium breve TaxID=1259258 RepID=UPI0032B22B55
MDDNDVENTGGTGSTGGAPASAALAIDPGAVLWSASEADRVGRPLLLILHGYGSHEGDLFSLAPHLPLKPVLAALRAPLPVGGGWAWFPIGVPGADVNPSAPSATAVEAATDSVLAWLDALVVPPASVGLLGFSQGGAMALQLLRQAPDRFAFAVQALGLRRRGAPARGCRARRTARSGVLGPRHGRPGDPGGCRRPHPGLAARPLCAHRAHLRGHGPLDLAG